MAQRTFSIIKPDAVGKGYTGAILAEIEKAGFKIVSIKKASISNEQAKGFYYVHAERPFFNDLCAFMSSGPLFLMVLEKDHAIADLRKLMGATNPANAEEGTVSTRLAGAPASTGPRSWARFDTGRTLPFRVTRCWLLTACVICGTGTGPSTAPKHQVDALSRPRQTRGRVVRCKSFMMAIPEKSLLPVARGMPCLEHVHCGGVQPTLRSVAFLDRKAMPPVALLYTPQ